MNTKDIENLLATMPGDQLLEEIVTYAAMWLDQHQQGEDDMEAMVRALQRRLHETKIATKHHSVTCEFMGGDDRCPCSIASWSWPRKGI